MLSPARLALVLVTASIAVFAATGSALAVTPANDNAGDASALSAYSPASDVSTDAGIEPTEPLTANDTNGCDASTHALIDDGTGAQGSHTLWYRVTGTGHAMDVTTAGSNYETVVAAYDTSISSTPDALSFKKCDDSSGPGNAAIHLDSTVVGRDYLIQVGGLADESGSAKVSVYAGPGNDDLNSAKTLSPNGILATNDNRGATLDSGETNSCSGAPDFGKTVWFKVALPARALSWTVSTGGSATTDTVLGVYDSGGQLGCNDDASDVSGGPSSVTLTNLDKGTYYVQVGGGGASPADAWEGAFSVNSSWVQDPDGDGDGYAPPQDCNDTNAAIHPGATDIAHDGIDQNCDGHDNLDGDADGYPTPQDCNDNQSSIHPGATDIPDNGIDEDCSGTDAHNADADGDGYLDTVDCKDTDPAIHPGAVDIPDDGIDQDCSGTDAHNTDADGDGYLANVDCNDHSSSVHPGATDTPDNGVDEDCSGADAHNSDVDGDGYRAPQDCNDNDPNVGPGARDVPKNGIDENCDGHDNLDGDGDGFSGVEDCNDGDPSTHAGAADEPGDWVDQNCDGRYPSSQLAPFPLILAPNGAWHGGTYFARLVVHNIARGEVVVVRCHGVGCPRTKRSVVGASKRAEFRSYRHRTLKPGAVIEVRVFVPGQNSIGAYSRYLATPKGARRRDLCLYPSSTPGGAAPKKPARCPGA
jgi:Putative metal-binding motif/Bacterial pre-peptidase C-terminal domain